MHQDTCKQLCGHQYPAKALASLAKLQVLCDQAGISCCMLADSDEDEYGDMEEDSDELSSLASSSSSGGEGKEGSSSGEERGLEEQEASPPPPEPKPKSKPKPKTEAKGV